MVDSERLTMSKEMNNTTDDAAFLAFIEKLEKVEMLQNGMQIASVVFYSLAFVLGVLGNGLVIFITSFRMKKTVNTVWFLNLAIADFIFIFSLIFVRVALDFKWYINTFLCKIKDVFFFLNIYASVYTLTVISIDRCIFIRHPVWAQNHRKPQQASFVALGVWILALVLSSPSLHFGGTVKDANNITKCFKAYGNDTDIHMSRQRDDIISQFIFAFVIPFTVIFLCYGAIVLKLRSSQLFQSSKPYKIMTALIVTFFVCWFPYHVYSFIDQKYSSNLDMLLLLNAVHPIALWLAFINSCVNPILYVFMAKGFKDSLKGSLFSAFENAFTEEARQTSTTNKTRSSAEVELQL